MRRNGKHSWTAALDRDELIKLGKVLEERPAMLAGRSTAEFLAEALLRVRSRHGEIVPLVANRAQAEFERRRGNANVVLKARQMGISTWVAGRFFLKTITQPGTLTLQVAHTQEAAEAIFKMVHRFAAMLPEPLRGGALKTRRANIRQIVFSKLDSEFRVVSAGDENAGRGLTVRNLHCSEVARWPGDAAAVLQGLRAAMPPDGELVMESTPRGASGCFWQEWQEAEAAGTVRHFFPWWWERSYTALDVDESTLTETEQALMETHGLTLGQIGFRRRLQASFRGMTKQEYAEDATECFLASGNCLFEVAAIDKRIKELPLKIAERMGGRLQVWYPPLPGKKYVVAVDPAGGGTEGDFAAAQVLDIETGLQCAELQAHLRPLEMAEESRKLAMEYNQGWLVIERNNHGAGVLAHLGGYAKVFHQNGAEGWLTTSSSRMRMLSVLGAALVEEPEIFSSERLLKECRGFVRLANGRTEAQVGSHDDCVLAMAIGLAAREQLRGKNC